jgi:hypothetical protein
LTFVMALLAVLVTLNVTLVPLPWGALGGLTVTSAAAGDAAPSTPAATAAARTPARRCFSRFLTTGSSDGAPEWFNRAGISFFPVPDDGRHA